MSYIYIRYCDIDKQYYDFILIMDIVIVFVIIVMLVTEVVAGVLKCYSIININYYSIILILITITAIIPFVWTTTYLCITFCLFFSFVPSP